MDGAVLSGIARGLAVAESSNDTSAPTTGHALFVRHQRGVNQLVYQLLGPDAEHDDIVQDVFVRVLSRASSLRDPERERAWVHSVAVNVVRNHLRRRRVRRIVELHPAPPDEVVRTEPVLVARDLVQRGYRVLGRIAPANRIALILRRVQGRSIDEVAALCKCSRATVKRRVQRAEAELENLLAEDPDLREQLGRRGSGS
ncbi:MAG: RNA polymerase sigma factor [Nannocystales bacterium]